MSNRTEPQWRRESQYMARRSGRSITKMGIPLTRRARVNVPGRQVGLISVRSLLIVLLIIFSLTSNLGCRWKSRATQTPGVPDNVGSAQLWVTRDFGAETLVAAAIKTSGKATVMDLLRSQAEVRTSYGGGFVDSINGLSSGDIQSAGGQKQKYDWFYYANGVISPVGAASYRPRPSDAIWWDYHRWDNLSFIPAVVGCYPNPFLNGLTEKTSTTIMAPAGWDQQAQEIASALEENGIQNVGLVELGQKSVGDREGPLIMIGPWSELKYDRFLMQLSEDPARRGVFVKIEDGSKDSEPTLWGLDDKGQTCRRWQGDVGAIVATGSGMGDPAPVWVITGLTPAGVRKASKIVTDFPEKLRLRCGVVVVGDEVVPIPLMQP